MVVWLVHTYLVEREIVNDRNHHAFVVEYDVAIVLAYDWLFAFPPILKALHM